MFIRISFALLGFVAARDANMQDVNAIGAAFVNGAKSIYRKAQNLPSETQMLNEIQQLNNAGASTGQGCPSCVRDFSSGPLTNGCYPCKNAAFLQGYVRKTQAPMVWINYNKSSFLDAPAGNLNFGAEDGASAGTENALPVINVKYHYAAAQSDPSRVLARAEENAALNRRTYQALASRSSFLANNADLVEIIKSIGRVEGPPQPFKN